MTLTYLDTEYRRASDRKMECIMACTSAEGRGRRAWHLYKEEDRVAFAEYVRDGYICCWSAEAEARTLDSLGVDVRKIRWYDGMAAYKMLHNGDAAYRHRYGLVEVCRSRGVPYTQDKVLHVAAILDGSWTADPHAVEEYCMADVDALQALMPGIFRDCSAAGIGEEEINWHSKWSAYLALVTRNGIPMDHKALAEVCAGSEWLQNRTIYRGNSTVYPFYTCSEGRWHFRYARFERYLRTSGLAESWPTTPSGKYVSDTDTLEYLGDETLQNFLSIRKQVSQLRSFQGVPNTDWQEHYAPPGIPGGPGMLRSYFNPCGTVTGRNAPPSRQFLPAMSSWLRALIRPPEGHVVLGADWGSQEYAIAAALSGDAAMTEAYNSTDPYYWWAQRTGAIPVTLPEGSTKADYRPVRNLYKSIILGLQYSMGARSLSRNITVQTGTPCSVGQARHYIELHKSTYRRYWRRLWDIRKRAEEFPDLPVKLADGWRLWPRGVKATTIGNFPVQGTGAVMLKLATMKAIDEGLDVIFPLHDAIYIVCREADMEENRRRLVGIMERAAGRVLQDAIKIRVDVSVHTRDDWWVDEKGREFFEFFSPLLGWKYELTHDEEGKPHYKRR